MIHVVIDTNVLVSAYLTRNPAAATYRVVEAMLQGRIVPLYDDEILAEYAEVMARDKFKINPEARQALMDYLLHYGIHTGRTPFGEMFADESDRVFYEVALSDADSFLVTGNLKHYPRSPQVVTPAEMMQIVEGM